MVTPAVGDQLNGMLLATAENDHYSALCEFTNKQFERWFSSHLEEFHPFILSFWSNNEIQAVVGFRAAVVGPLFLEQYLDEPVEVVLDTDRKFMVEIGGFAAVNRAVALPLMRHAADSLQQAGFTTAVCTANRPIRSCLRKFGIEFAEIGVANPEFVGESRTSWGSYYKSEPKVIAGDIATGVAAMGRLLGASN